MILYDEIDLVIEQVDIKVYHNNSRSYVPTGLSDTQYCVYYMYFMTEH